jgi:uncharacterized protein
MTLDPQVTQYVLMALVLAAAAVLQGTVGFAYALLATPLLTGIGLPLPRIMAMVATASLVQCVVGVRQLGPDVPWPLVLSGTLVRYAGTLAGSLVLLCIVALPRDELRLVVGCVVAAIVLAQLALRVRPAAALHAVWAWVAFAASGLLAGLTGMGGPPLVIWATAHDWPMRRVRGFLFAMFVFALPFQLLLLWLMFPSDTLGGMRDGFYLTPLVLLSSVAGVWLGNRVPGPWLRAAIYGVLIASAAGLVVPALLDFLR